MFYPLPICSALVQHPQHLQLYQYPLARRAACC